MGQGSPQLLPLKQSLYPSPFLSQGPRAQQDESVVQRAGLWSPDHPKSCLGNLISRKARPGSALPRMGMPRKQPPPMPCQHDRCADVSTDEPPIGCRVQEQWKTDLQVSAETAPADSTHLTRGPPAQHVLPGTGQAAAPAQGEGNTNEGTN